MRLTLLLWAQLGVVLVLGLAVFSSATAFGIQEQQTLWGTLGLATLTLGLPYLRGVGPGAMLMRLRVSAVLAVVCLGLIAVAWCVTIVFTIGSGRVAHVNTISSQPTAQITAPSSEPTAQITTTSSVSTAQVSTTSLGSSGQVLQPSHFQLYATLFQATIELAGILLATLLIVISVRVQTRDEYATRLVWLFTSVLRTLFIALLFACLSSASAFAGMVGLDAAYVPSLVLTTLTIICMGWAGWAMFRVVTASFGHPRY